jgi:hypothetical protein
MHLKMNDVLGVRWRKAPAWGRSKIIYHILVNRASKSAAREEIIFTGSYSLTRSVFCVCLPSDKLAKSPHQ